MKKLMYYMNLKCLKIKLLLKTDASGSITIGEAIGQTEKAFGLKLSIPFYKILRIVS